MPLHLQILPPNTPNPRASFRFESLWLRESHCQKIMVECWSRTHGQSLMDRVGACGKAIWIWGKHFARNFQRRLDYWHKRMDATKHRRDQFGISLYKEAQFQYLRTLQHQTDYWRQRAKQFWLKEGDTNSNFFHKSVKRRQQTNRLTQLKDNNGVWIDRGTLLTALVGQGPLRAFSSSTWTRLLIKKATRWASDSSFGTILVNSLLHVDFHGVTSSHQLRRRLWAFAKL